MKAMAGSIIILAAAVILASGIQAQKHADALAIAAMVAAPVGILGLFVLALGVSEPRPGGND